MRGKAIAQTSSCRRTGITPAYAGKSFVSFFHCTTFWDHPRVCGEKVGGISARSCCTGSPPRMRGKAGFAMYLDVSARITPAYAGKRKSCAAQKTSAWDHPRMCGEKASHSATLFGVGGSPPHVRGKVGRTLYLVAGERITPAYAGKRLKRSRSTVPHVAIVPLFPSVCNKPVVSDGSPAGRDAPLFLPAENAVPASPAYNLRSL